MHMCVMLLCAFQVGCQLDVQWKDSLLFNHLLLSNEDHKTLVAALSLYLARGVKIDQRTWIWEKLS